MAYNANDIAKYVIARCSQNGTPISNLQLQKIMYYLQGYYLAVFDSPLFKEPIYAWKLGPVVPEVYRHFNYFGSEPILDDGAQSNTLNCLAKGPKELIDAVIDAKSRKSAWQLVNDTHKENPWMVTDQSQIIDNNIIKRFFKEFINTQLRGS